MNKRGNSILLWLVLAGLVTSCGIGDLVNRRELEVDSYCLNTIAIYLDNSFLGDVSARGNRVFRGIAPTTHLVQSRSLSGTVLQESTIDFSQRSYVVYPCR